MRSMPLSIAKTGSSILFLVLAACGDETTAAPPVASGGAGGNGSAGRAGTAGAAGTGTGGAAAGKAGSAGNSTGGSTSGAGGGSGTGGGGANAGGSSAGTGGTAGATAGTGGTAAGAGGASAGTGGATAGTGGSAGSNAGASGSAGASGGNAGQGGSTAGASGSGGQAGGADEACEPNSVRCEGVDLVTCSADGKSDTRETCAYCDGVAKACKVCEPLVYACNGSTLTRCLPNGQDFLTSPCNGATPVCDAGAGECRACIAGSYRCDGAKLQQCNAGGSDYVTQTTCADAPLCNAAAGKCDAAVCDIGAIRCTANKPSRCTDGKKYTPDANACDAGQACAENIGCDDVKDIVAGARHACSLTKGGAVFCWGDNTSGQCGTNVVGGTGTLPTEVRFPNGIPLRAKSIAAGNAHTCVVDEADKAYCWGSNAKGQLGLGQLDPKSTGTPTAVIAPGKLFGIAAGGEVSCAFHEPSPGAKLVVACWGANNDGQIGKTTTADLAKSFPSPEPIPYDGGAIAASNGIAVAADHVCATYNSNAVCWGAGNVGQLGRPILPLRVGGPAPVLVAGAGGTLEPLKLAANITAYGRTSVAGSPLSIAATGHTCANRFGIGGPAVDQELLCWGAGVGGALGLGDEKNRTQATLVGPGYPTSAGPAIGCFVSGVGAAAKESCAGDNRKGILGIAGLAQEKLLTPKATLPIFVRTFGAEFSCYLLDDGAAGKPQTLCAGKNGQGQLGKPGPDATIPVVVAY